MTFHFSPKAALIGGAFYAIATGILLLFLKGPIVLPTVAWLRSLTTSELDTYLSLLARGSIAIGAVTLFAVVVASHFPRAARHSDTDDE